MEQEAESPHAPISSRAAMPNGKRPLEGCARTDGSAAGTAPVARKLARTELCTLSPAAAPSASRSACSAGLMPIRTSAAPAHLLPSSCSIDSDVSAALSFLPSFTAQAAGTSTMLTRMSAWQSEVAAAAAATSSFTCQQHQHQLLANDDEPCTPRASSVSDSIFSPARSNATRPCSVATAPFSSASTPTDPSFISAGRRFSACAAAAAAAAVAAVAASPASTPGSKAAAIAAGAAATVSASPASAALGAVAAARAAPRDAAPARRVLSFSAWAPEAGAAGSAAAAASPRGTLNATADAAAATMLAAGSGRSWWLPSRGAPPTAPSDGAAVLSSPSARVVLGSPNLGGALASGVGGGFGGSGSGAPCSSNRVPDRMATGRGTLLRSPLRSPGAQPCQHQEGGCGALPPRPRNYLASAQELMQLTMQAQRNSQAASPTPAATASNSGNTSAGAAAGAGPLLQGAALPWAVTGRALSIRTQPLHPTSSASSAHGHTPSAHQPAAVAPTGADACTPSAAVGAASPLFSGRVLLTSALAITPGVWRLAGPKASSGTTSGPNGGPNTATNPEPQCLAQDGAEARLQEPLLASSPAAHRGPLMSHPGFGIMPAGGQVTLTCPAADGDCETPRAAAATQGSDPSYSTPRAAATATQAGPFAHPACSGRSPLFSPADSTAAASGCGGGAGSWGMVGSPVGGSGGGSVAGKSSGSPSAAPGSVTPVSQPQRPSRFATVRINRDAQLRFVLASTLADMAHQSEQAPATSTAPAGAPAPGKSASPAASAATCVDGEARGAPEPALSASATAGAPVDVEAAQKAYPQLVARAFQDWLNLHAAGGDRSSNDNQRGA